MSSLCIRFLSTTHSLASLARSWWIKIVCTRKTCNKKFITYIPYQFFSLQWKKSYGIHIIFFTAVKKIVWIPYHFYLMRNSHIFFNMCVINYYYYDYPEDVLRRSQSMMAIILYYPILLILYDTLYYLILYYTFLQSTVYCLRMQYHIHSYTFH